MFNISIAAFNKALLDYLNFEYVITGSDVVKIGLVRSRERVVPILKGIVFDNSYVNGRDYAIYDDFRGRTFFPLWTKELKI